MIPSRWQIWTLIATLALAPAVAQADEGRHVTFVTSEVDLDRPGGAVEGTLQITIYAAGNFVGYYRPVDNGRLIDVLGSISGQNIYLLIGNERPIQGAYVDGKIEAYRGDGPDDIRFTAVRAAEGVGG